MDCAHDKVGLVEPHPPKHRALPNPKTLLRHFCWRISILAFVCLALRRTVLGLRLKRIGREFVIKDDIQGGT